MSIQELKSQIPDYAKDLRINLGNIVTADNAPGLNDAQRWGVAVASAYATGNRALLDGIATEAGEALDDSYAAAARTAAAIMGMNNVYYRFLHLASNTEYGQLPARLRMTAVGNPGIPKEDFELFSLAVSAINGCGSCVDAHEKVVREAGLKAEGVQSAIRIAAVINAVSVVLDQEG